MAEGSKVASIVVESPEPIVIPPPPDGTNEKNVPLVKKKLNKNEYWNYIVVLNILMLVGHFLSYNLLHLILQISFHYQIRF